MDNLSGHVFECDPRRAGPGGEKEVSACITGWLALLFPVRELCMVQELCRGRYLAFLAPQARVLSLGHPKAISIPAGFLLAVVDVTGRPN